MTALREGRTEILNETSPDILAGIHEAYLEAGAECLIPGRPRAGYVSA
jgi:methionine synthase I (cobalamin-dependent)